MSQRKTNRRSVVQPAEAPHDLRARAEERMRLVRADVAKLSADELHGLAAALWREPVWDLKIVAGRMLTGKGVLPDARLWRFVTERMGDLDGWAIADNLAGAASRCLIADERRLDDAELWVKNPHLWTRRAALVFTLPWAKQQRDPDRMLGWAATLTSDPEWFIQKAIGWWLRELSKRDSSRVRHFLKMHGAAMKPFARREAEKYLL